MNNLPPGVSNTNIEAAQGDWKTRHVFGRKAMFCCDGCAESFREDRKHGLIYGQIYVGDKLYSWEAGSIVGEFCAYCHA